MAGARLVLGTVGDERRVAPARRAGYDEVFVRGPQLADAIRAQTDGYGVDVALDPADRENGCMRVIPGTHRGGFSEYEAVDSTSNTFDRQIKNMDESQAVYFELAPGECSLHDSRIMHGASANTSPRRRCGYTMRYFATDAKVDPVRNATHKIWLARGEDLAGNTYENA